MSHWKIQHDDHVNWDLSCIIMIVDCNSDCRRRREGKARTKISNASQNHFVL